jgi:hypothetical protein
MRTLFTWQLLTTICTLLFLIASTTGLYAQEEDKTDFQTWMDYKAYYQFENKLQFTPDAGIRGVVSKEVWNQVFLRPSFVHRTKDWLQGHGGIGLWFTDENNEENKFEIRPWQGAKIIWPKPGSLVFSHFFRLEERMTVAPAWEFTLRFRYQIGLKSPNLHFKSIPDRPFYGFVGFEIFVDVIGDTEERYVNRNRLTLKLGNQFTSAWRFELEYIRQGSRRDTSEGFRTSEHMLRLRIRHNIKSTFTVF